MYSWAALSPHSGDLSSRCSFLTSERCSNISLNLVCPRACWRYCLVSLRHELLRKPRACARHVHMHIIRLVLGLPWRRTRSTCCRGEVEPPSTQSGAHCPLSFAKREFTGRVIVVIIIFMIRAVRHTENGPRPMHTTLSLVYRESTCLIIAKTVGSRGCN